MLVVKSEDMSIQFTDAGCGTVTNYTNQAAGGVKAACSTAVFDGDGVKKKNEKKSEGAKSFNCHQ